MKFSICLYNNLHFEFKIWPQWLSVFHLLLYPNGFTWRPTNLAPKLEEVLYVILFAYPHLRCSYPVLMLNCTLNQFQKYLRRLGPFDSKLLSVQSGQMNNYPLIVAHNFSCHEMLLFVWAGFFSHAYICVYEFKFTYRLEKHQHGRSKHSNQL